MDFKIVWTLRSREDLRDIATFIAKDNPPAALKLGDLIFARVDTLEKFPELGRWCRNATDRTCARLW